MNWVRINPDVTVDLDDVWKTAMYGETLVLHFNNGRREDVAPEYRGAIWARTAYLQCRGGSGSLSMTCPHCGKRAWIMSFHINIDEARPMPCGHCQEDIYFRVHGSPPDESSPESSTS